MEINHGFGDISSFDHNYAYHDVHENDELADNKAGK